MALVIHRDLAGGTHMSCDVLLGSSGMRVLATAARRSTRGTTASITSRTAADGDALVAAASNSTRHRRRTTGGIAPKGPPASM